MKKLYYSIILPIRNEDQSLPQLFDEIEQTFRGKPHEVIAIDDASTDQSLQTLRKIAKNSPSRRIIHLGEHLGKWAAIRAGIAKAHGDIIVTIDSDLQDDPKEILRLLPVLNRGYDVVSGWRKLRQDDWYKIVISNLGNALISLLARKKFHDLNAPMKVYRRIALMGLPREGSLLRFSLLFAHKLGYQTAEVSVRHRNRRYGKSKFGVIKYFRILYDSLLIFFLFSGSGRITRITEQSIETKDQGRLRS